MTRLAAAILLVGTIAIAACSNRGDSSTVAPALTHNATGTAPAEPCDQCGVVTKISRIVSSNSPSGDTIKAPPAADSRVQPQTPAFSWQIVARLNSGQIVTVTYSADPGLAVGDNVQYVNGYFAKEKTEPGESANAGSTHR